MDADAIIAEWQRRLVVLAHNPPYVFIDTPADRIERHQRKLITFVGYRESEVAEAEAWLGGRLPDVFRTYLLRMGQSPGELFRGSDLTKLSDLEPARADALELMAEADPSSSLPSDAAVFLWHQGYTFSYLQAGGGFDGPVVQWMVSTNSLEQISPTFAAVVDSELDLMEHNNRTQIESGGYYLTLFPGGGAMQSHPARAKGERPLDQQAASGVSNGTDGSRKDH